jgi:iron-sulfur cluster repair protein YtfE (RIC family)
MKRTLVIVQQVIEEHKAIFQRLDQVVNDAEALGGVEKAKEAFMPGRPGQQAGLAKLEEMVKLIDTGLRAHFDREETAVLAAFEEEGSREMATAFHSLLSEHEDLKNRLTQTKNKISQLINGKLSRHQWEANGYDLRAYLSHTRKLLEAHAAIEQELLLSLQHRLIEKNGVS